jgi:diguanylate cyclase (GGDEF)-like protein/PAS domain S-box-containing protein
VTPIQGLWPLAIAAVVALVTIVAAYALNRRLRTYRTEVERLTKDVHGLLADAVPGGRIRVNGRSSEFVDITACINRLLERAVEQGKPGTTIDDTFDLLANTIPEVTLIHSDVILYANQVAGDLLGVEPSVLRGKRVTDLMRPAYRAAMRKIIGSDATSDAALKPIEVQLINGDERGFWAELHSRRLSFDGASAFITVAKNITDRKSLEASVGRGKVQARVTLESIGEGIITTDTDGTIDYMNETAEQLIAVSRSLAIGRKLPELIALIDEVGGESLGDPVALCLHENRRINLGRRARLVGKQSKQEFSTELTASPIRGPDRETSGCVVIFHDVSEMRGFAQEMSYQASHDALTGLVNRPEFQRRLDLALEVPRDGTGYVVCYLDLDRFKTVNDTCGHMVGDNLLREIAKLLKEQVRDSDTVARFGGDEFAMLLSGCPLEKARQIADDVCQAVMDYSFTWNDRVFQLGVSIGLVQVSLDGGSAETVLNAADSACYVAKQQGRGRVHVYSARDELISRERGEIQWLQRLQTALNENQFELYVQPIIALGNHVGRGPAAELLLRMRDESGRTIAPSQFLGAAERYQLMSHLDRWVVRSALTMIANGMPHLPQGRVCCINLSGQTLGDEDFLEFVVDLLDHTGVAPEKICFEVSEAAVLKNIDHARRFINVVHGIGCQFGLDDFGSGIGSFANLKHLSIDYLKVDGSYTKDLEERSVNWELLGAMITLSRRLDFLVVAEQVEDQASFDLLRDLGVDFIQGNIVERPHRLTANVN